MGICESKEAIQQRLKEEQERQLLLAQQIEKALNEIKQLQKLYGMPYYAIVNGRFIGDWEEKTIAEIFNIIQKFEKSHPYCDRKDVYKFTWEPAKRFKSTISWYNRLSGAGAEKSPEIDWELKESGKDFTGKWSYDAWIKDLDTITGWPVWHSPCKIALLNYLETEGFELVSEQIAPQMHSRYTGMEGTIGEVMQTLFRKKPSE